MPPSTDEIAAAAAAAVQEPHPAVTDEQSAAGGEQEAAQEHKPAAEDAITHHEPILAGGSAGAVVRRLVDLLTVAGHHTNSIVTGENPGVVLDNTVMADVEAFAKEHGVTEDPGLGISGKFVGPATWQALFDEAAKVLNL
jgi:hypothetical protein